MKIMLRLMLISAFALLVSAPAAFAQIPESSPLPVDEPLDVGGTILQPGMYTIEVLKRGDDNRVVVKDKDGNAVASVLTTPHQLEPNEEVPNTTFVYYPAGEGQPRALRTWFPAFPASEGGRDIMYEESRLAQLRRIESGGARETTLVTTTEPAPAPAPAPTFTPAPAPAPEPMVSSAPPVQTAEATTPEMPETAGELPLIALIGVLSIAAAVGLRFFRA